MPYADREKARERARLYYANNRERVRRSQRLYYERIGHTRKKRLMEQMATRRARQYGLTLSQYRDALKRPCDVCGHASGRRFVDHDHRTGRVRGTLCFDCNTAIGKLGDTADGLRRALSYLERSEREDGR